MVRYVTIVPEDSAARRVPGARWVMAGAAALVVAADQVSKTLILAANPPYGESGWIMVRLVRNTGASGGIASGYPVLVTLAALVIAVLAALLAVRSRSRTAAISLAVVCGGALGNLADRIFRAPGFGRGGVVDWIHIAGGGGSFNLADTAIQFGVIVTVVAMFTADRAPRRSRREIQVQKAE
jgi:signal peptidase II